MGTVLTVVAISLAWFGFRYERHAARARAVEEALGTLRAVWHGMVEPREPGHGIFLGWGQIYFSEDYADTRLLRRMAETRRRIRRRSFDQVFVVPTEPLARLASTRPSPGLITESTVSHAGFALWRVEVFNQLVTKMTEWNVLHAAEIVDTATTPERRRLLANAAAAISHEVHGYGVGKCWGEREPPEQGWYRALVESLLTNMHALEGRFPRRPPWWKRWASEGAYPFIDTGLFTLFVATVVYAFCWT